jgi:hypothetical protein
VLVIGWNSKSAAKAGAASKPATGSKLIGAARPVEAVKPPAVPKTEEVCFLLLCDEIAVADLPVLAACFRAAKTKRRRSNSISPSA